MFPSDATYLAVKSGVPIYVGLAIVLALLAAFVRDHWRDPNV